MAVLILLWLPRLANAEQRAYVANLGSDTVSVVAVDSQTVIATIPVGDDPDGVAATRDGSRVYVANFLSDDVSVIDTGSNAVVATISVSSGPVGLAVTPDAQKLYVTNRGAGTVSIVSSASNQIVATVAVGSGPDSVAFTPDGALAYVTNSFTRSPGTVSVIDTATNRVIAMIEVQRNPNRVAASDDGRNVYVANFRSGNLAVIDVATQKVVDYVALPGLPTGIAVHPNSSLIYVATLGGSVVVVDAVSHEWTNLLPIGGELYGLVTTRRGDLGFVANFASDNLATFDLVAETAGAVINTDVRPFAVAMTCTGSECDAPPFTPRPTRTPTNTWTPTTTEPPTSTPRPGPYACSGGPRDGAPCGSDDECSEFEDFGVCVLVLGVCDSGPQFDGFPCDCPGGICSAGACIGGNFAGDACTSEAGNGGCDAGIACVATVQICLSGVIKGFGCLRRDHCDGAECASTGKFCDGGEYTDFPCVDSGDCYRGTCVPPFSLPSPTPTHLPGSPPPTASPTAIRAPMSLVASTVQGRRGSLVTFGVSLHTAGFSVSGTQNDLQFDADTPIAVRSRNRPDCTANAAINKPTTSFAFLPSGCQPGTNCTAIRALVFSIEDNAPIPDAAELYHCNVSVATNATLGTHPLRVTGVIGASPAGFRVEATGGDGAIVVSASAQRGIDGGTSAAAGGGCRIDPASGSGAWLLLLFGLAAYVRSRLQ
jgi:YVTN family beta-propeller protein